MAKQTNLVRTGMILACPKCCAFTQELMDDDGVRYCRRCHERISDD